jgi:hypothetical protein
MCAVDEINMYELEISAKPRNVTKHQRGRLLLTAADLMSALDANIIKAGRYIRLYPALM